MYAFAQSLGIRDVQDLFYRIRNTKHPVSQDYLDGVECSAFLTTYLAYEEDGLAIECARETHRKRFSLFLFRGEGPRDIYVDELREALNGN